jgi:hypothetical protein
MHVWMIDSERGRSIASNPATKVMSSEYGYIIVRKLKPDDDMIVQLQQTHMLVAIYLHWHDLGSWPPGCWIIPACCACSRYFFFHGIECCLLRRVDTDTARVKAWSRAPPRGEGDKNLRQFGARCHVESLKSIRYPHVISKITCAIRVFTHPTWQRAPNRLKLLSPYPHVISRLVNKFQEFRSPFALLRIKNLFVPRVFVNFGDEDLWNFGSTSGEDLK